MPTETKVERGSVNVDKDIYEMFAKLAKLLELPVREAANEALQDWCKRNAAAARRKANQLLPAA